MQYLRTRLVSKEDWQAAHARTGSIYFIRDHDHDCIKVGHSKDPVGRLQTLQVGSAGRLGLIGIFAAPIEIEKHVHFQLMEGRTHGEWFWDRGVTTRWLMDMTQGEPICRHVWTLVPGTEVFWDWKETTKSHTKHVWNATARAWEPPFGRHM